MIKLAAAENELNNFDAKSWSELLITSVEGGLLLGKAQNDTSVIKRVLMLYRSQLQLALDK